RGGLRKARNGIRSDYGREAVSWTSCSLRSCSSKPQCPGRRVRAAVYGPLSRPRRAKMIPPTHGGASAMPTYEYTTEDIEYLRHGDLGLKLRLYKPKGAGPFPAVIDLPGGAWGKGSLEACKDRDQALAK